jgi:hypothetical protein
MPHVQVGNPGHELLSDERIPDPTFTGPYAAMNTSFGNPAQYPLFQVAVCYCPFICINAASPHNSFFQGVY